MFTICSFIGFVKRTAFLFLFVLAPDVGFQRVEISECHPVPGLLVARELGLPPPGHFLRPRLRSRCGKWPVFHFGMEMGFTKCAGSFGSR